MSEVNFGILIIETIYNTNSYTSGIIYICDIYISHLHEYVYA